MASKIIAEVREMIERADKLAAYGLLQKWAAEHGNDKLITQVLEPILREIGERWEREGASLAQGYVMAKVAEDFLVRHAVDRSRNRSDADIKGPVVLGNIEDDCHALGRRMVGIFLEADGWEVHDLGNDVLANDFVNEANKIGAKVIGVSAMMYTTATNIKRLRKEIDQRGLAGKVQLAVGGAVFVLRPELVEEVGGDGTARNAVAAPALFGRLWDEACRREAAP